MANLTEQEKAVLFDTLMDDMSRFAEDLAKYKNSVEKIKTEPTGRDSQSENYAILLGKYEGSVSTLAALVHRLNTELNWFKNY